MTVQEHTGTAIWWRSGAEDWWHYQQMMVTDAEAAVAAARREGYVPRDAEVVATEPTYTNRLHLAHGYTTGMEEKSLTGIMGCLPPRDNLQQKPEWPGKGLKPLNIN